MVARPGPKVQDGNREALLLDGSCCTSHRCQHDRCARRFERCPQFERDQGFVLDNKDVASEEFPAPHGVLGGSKPSVTKISAKQYPRRWPKTWRFTVIRPSLLAI